MFSTVKSMSLDGIEGYLVEVETDISPGLPSFNVVGLPDASIKEAKERVRASIRNSNIEFPSRKILVNLSPADRRKEGTGFDLPIAVGILITMGIIKPEKIEGFEQTIFLGELSLDGKLNPVKGILPMCIDAKELGIRRAIVPKQNAREAAVIEDLNVIPISNLENLIDYINGIVKVKKQTIDLKNILKRKDKYNIDFCEVKGQENAKRALEIAVAGGHNCIFVGSPRFREKYVISKSSNNFTRLNV